MQPVSKQIKEVDHTFEFSICTFVTDKDEYSEMLSSFAEKGFNSSICEYLHIDNSKANSYGAYTGINLFLSQSQGKYVIICHQDVVLHSDDIDKLRACLRNLDALDPDWGICGNAGGAGPNHIVYHISYPDDLFMSKGRFPVRVSALDENFILLKSKSAIRASPDLSGFHLYATDLCLKAELNGYSAYAIDFKLLHKSRGNKSKDFFELRLSLIKKYNRFFRSRWIQTNSTVFYLSGSLLGRLGNNKLFLFVVRMWNGLRKER